MSKIKDKHKDYLPLAFAFIIMLLIVLTIFFQTMPTRNCKDKNFENGMQSGIGKNSWLSSVDNHEIKKGHYYCFNNTYDENNIIDGRIGKSYKYKGE